MPCPHSQVPPLSPPAPIVIESWHLLPGIEGVFVTSLSLLPSYGSLNEGGFVSSCAFVSLSF
jgi:hypothetical protein